jgi:uncharacterized protein
MHSDIAERRLKLAELCRRYGATRLEVFGSPAGGDSFDMAHSDADFLVTFTPAARNNLEPWKQAKTTSGG